MNAISNKILLGLIALSIIFVHFNYVSNPDTSLDLL